MKKLFLSIISLIFVCSAFAMDLQNNIQKQVENTLLSKQNKQNPQPLQLTASIAQWGIRYPSFNEILPPEKVYVSAPDYKIPEEYSFYVIHHFNYAYHFIYKATAQEIEKNLSKEYTVLETEPVSGWQGPAKIQVVDADKLIENRPLVEAYVSFDGTQRSPATYTTVKCKAYALSNQWLITSASCPLIKSVDIPSLPAGFEDAYGQEVERIYINKKPITRPAFTQNEHILLIEVPGTKENKEMISLLDTKHKLDVSAYSKIDFGSVDLSLKKEDLEFIQKTIRK